MSEQTLAQLGAAQVPENIAQRVHSETAIAPAELATLTAEQRRAVEAARLELIGREAARVGGVAGATIGTAVGVMAMVGSFVFGLLGWLLVMKKRVLQCVTCGAVVAAS